MSMLKLDVYKRQRITDRDNYTKIVTTECRN